MIGRYAPSCFVFEVGKMLCAVVGFNCLLVSVLVVRAVVVIVVVSKSPYRRTQTDRASDGRCF